MTHHLDSEDFPTNLSNNEHFQNVVNRAVSRRGFLVKSGAGAAAVAFMSTGLTACGGGDDDEAKPLLGFTAIAAYDGNEISVAPSYTATAFAPWGTPLFSSGPGSTWSGTATETAADQARQVGDNHDGIRFYPINGKNDEGLLVMNHEYTNVAFLFADGAVNSLDDANKDLNAHGVTVVHIKRTNGAWQVVVDSQYNRRITGNTLMQLTGPAAGDALLQTSADPTGTAVFGTLNNCGNGWTPWGTYLTCEENFNQYFGTTNVSARRTPYLTASAA
jgi:secreted PhoX family phosphatase